MLVTVIERRKLEVFVAIGTLGFGIWLLLPGDGMSTEAYKSLLRLMPEWQWGVQFFVIGLAHLTALAVNHQCWWACSTRAVMSAATAMLYALFAGGFWMVNPNTTAVFSYGWHSLAAAWCMYFAILEASTDRKKRRAVPTRAH